MTEYFKTAEFGDTVSRLCFKSFDNLPKTGKPKSEEWTVLACVVKSINTNLEVIALGTGSKCLGQNQMSVNGDVINDSHAEVMARRGFVRYLYDQIELAANSKPSIMTINDDGKFALSPDIHFHFFTSQTPCGDASIIIESDDDDTIPLKRTGAKCFKSDVDSTRDYDKPVLGQVRRKPGKGDPTLSVSCSDKLARWIRIGFQGALLDTLLQDPITVKSITIGNDVPFCKLSVHRALIQRIATTNDEQNNASPLIEPEILHSTLKFSTRNDSLKPCDSSIVWCKVKDRPLEIAVEGKKQGVTKKNISKISSCLKISKKCLFIKYMSILKLLNSSGFKADVCDVKFLSGDRTYKQMKNESLRYNKKWNCVKECFFGIWSEKPDILNFTSGV